MLTECWMHDGPCGKDIEATFPHPVVYLVPLNVLVVAFV